MAQANFYIIYIKRKKEITYESVKEKMDLSVDWYRINEQLFVLYTTSDAEKWYSRLSPFVKESGSLFVSKLNTNDRQGWMVDEFWKWLRREKDNT